ncbi:MAG: hypothetical protein JSR23_05670 [Proteobacteria bacterium]|nr:hypothetical protein [Pseudomonadota bacterium]
MRVPKERLMRTLGLPRNRYLVRIDVPQDAWDAMMPGKVSLERATTGSSPTPACCTRCPR